MILSYYSEINKYLSSYHVLKKIFNTYNININVFHLPNISSLYYYASFKNLDFMNFDYDYILLDDSNYNLFLKNLEKEYYLEKQKKLNNYFFYIKMLERIKNKEIKIILPKNSNYINGNIININFNPLTKFVIEKFYNNIYFLKKSIFSNLEEKEKEKEIFYFSSKRNYDDKIREKLKDKKIKFIYNMKEWEIINIVTKNISIINCYNEDFFRVRYVLGYLFNFINYELSLNNKSYHLYKKYEIDYVINNYDSILEEQKEEFKKFLDFNLTIEFVKNYLI